MSDRSEAAERTAVLNYRCFFFLFFCLSAELFASRGPDTTSGPFQEGKLPSSGPPDSGIPGVFAPARRHCRPRSATVGASRTALLSLALARELTLAIVIVRRFYHDGNGCSSK